MKSHLVYRRSRHETRFTKYGIRNTEKGAILIFTFIFLVTLTAIVAAYLTLVTRQTKSAGSQRDDKATLYIAEAGLQKARWAIGTGGSLPWQESNNLGLGAYSAWAVDNGDGTVTITSEGYIPNATNYRIRRKVDETSISYSYTNLSLAATASASSSQGAQIPSKSNDGNTNTFWSAGTKGPGEWLAMDYGSATTMNQMVILEKNNIDGLTIEYSSNGSTWTTVPGLSVVESPAKTWTANFTSTSDRYFQAVFTSVPSNKRAQVKELESYGTSTLGQGTFAEYW